MFLAWKAISLKLRYPSVYWQMSAQADLLIHEQMRKHNVQPPGAEVERPMNKKHALTLAGAAFLNHFDERQISLNVESWGV